jgi:hypothetical protein
MTTNRCDHIHTAYALEGDAWHSRCLDCDAGAVITDDRTLAHIMVLVALMAL